MLRTAGRRLVGCARAALAAPRTHTAARPSGVWAQQARGFSATTSAAKTHDVLCFPGDGIGPEIVAAAQHIIDASGVSINWHNMDMGFDVAQRGGDYLTEDHLQAFEQHKILFKGPLTIPPGDSKTYIEMRGRRFTSGNQVFRKVYQLYANVRPARSRPGVAAPIPNVDLVVIRENTEDIYTGEEVWVDDDTVEGVKRITRGASERIARFAGEYAINNGRKRITGVHKANVCKQSDGLFLSTFHATLDGLGHGIQIDDHLADSLITALVLRPQEYDVLCCPNLFGDLISDLAGGMIGSLGLCPSANIGAEHALFEPAHGSAPDIANQGIANPASQILSGVLMLRHLGEHGAADRIEAAFDATLESGLLPIDLGGEARTAAVVDAIIGRL